MNLFVVGVVVGFFFAQKIFRLFPKVEGFLFLSTFSFLWVQIWGGGLSGAFVPCKAHKKNVQFKPVPGPDPRGC